MKVITVLYAQVKWKSSTMEKIVLTVDVVEMIENKENQYEPLDGEHQSNDIPNVDWNLHNEEQETIKLKPCNRRRLDTK